MLPCDDVGSVVVSDGDGKQEKLTEPNALALGSHARQTTRAVSVNSA